MPSIYSKNPHNDYNTECFQSKNIGLLPQPLNTFLHTNLQHPWAQNVGNSVLPLLPDYNYLMPHTSVANTAIKLRYWATLNLVPRQEKVCRDLLNIGLLSIPFGRDIKVTATLDCKCVLTDLSL